MKTLQFALICGGHGHSHRSCSIRFITANLQSKICSSVTAFSPHLNMFTYPVAFIWCQVHKVDSQGTYYNVRCKSTVGIKAYANCINTTLHSFMFWRCQTKNFCLENEILTNTRKPPMIGPFLSYTQEHLMLRFASIQTTTKSAIVSQS